MKEQKKAVENRVSNVAMAGVRGTMSNLILNKSSGNMYPWVTHTWNPIRGKCSHDCVYCYMKVWPQKPLRLDAPSLDYDLGSGKTILVGSSTDMWAREVPTAWIESVLSVCKHYPQNTYLFQTKNPARWQHFDFPDNIILATTIETNRVYPDSIGKAPSVEVRYMMMVALEHPRKTITIEPIMDFDLTELVQMIEAIKPEFVSIGADSKNHRLPEPPSDKIKALIEELQRFTTVKQKDNLKRLLSSHPGQGQQRSF